MKEPGIGPTVDVPFCTQDVTGALVDDFHHAMDEGHVGPSGRMESDDLSDVHLRERDRFADDKGAD